MQEKKKRRNIVIVIAVVFGIILLAFVFGFQGFNANLNQEEIVEDTLVEEVVETQTKVPIATEIVAVETPEPTATDEVVEVDDANTRFQLK